MSAPPGMARPSAALDARQGVGTRRVQALASHARRIADEQSLVISQNRIQRLVRRFIAERRADIDFRCYFLGYADPTGEAAVRNVMRSRQ